MAGTADFDYRDFQTSEADKSLLVKFFVKPREDKAASALEGRPIFRDTEYIDIKIPGNRGSGACRPATEQDKNRFPEHYAKFKQRVTDEMEEGTPLSEWAPMSRSTAEELAFFHVKTVEQLANMADVQVAKFKGLFELQAKAKSWLKNAQEDRKFFEVEKEMGALRADNEALRKQLTEMIDILKSQEDETKTPQQKKRAKTRAVKGAEEAMAFQEAEDKASA